MVSKIVSLLKILEHKKEKFHIFPSFVGFSGRSGLKCGCDFSLSLPTRPSRRPSLLAQTRPQWIRHQELLSVHKRSRPQSIRVGIQTWQRPSTFPRRILEPKRPHFQGQIAMGWCLWRPRRTILRFQPFPWQIRWTCWIQTRPCQSASLWTCLEISSLNHTYCIG